MLEDIEKNHDSGVGSMPNSKDRTPERQLTPTNPMAAIEEDFENEDDETLTERLIGLTEMFPESVRNTTYSSIVLCKDGVKGCYSFARSASWIIFTTGMMMFAPVLFEVERIQVQAAQLQQQKQVLLGPSTAVTSGPNPMSGMPLMPPQ